LEKENLGPEELYKLNKKIILLRVTGYGQEGEMSLRPGHDLNYIASSGILKSINASDSSEKMQFPSNFLADFVSASLGIANTLKALKLRKTTGEGYVVDCSLAGGCAYLASMVKSSKKISDSRLEYYEAEGKRYVITCYSNEVIKSKDDIKTTV
jgi:alpha-methylacyl-CoA racemase